MNSNHKVLHVVMYHYVRDLPRTRFPRIKGLLIDEFREQVRWLSGRFEMCTLEAALGFLRGEYRPSRDLCMFTFDDGLKEHYAEVMPILVDYRIQGLFGIITSCVEEHCVAPVHMNHFLMAALQFKTYRSAFLAKLQDVGVNAAGLLKAHGASAQRSYPLDTPDVASFKYLFNFLVEEDVRDRVVRELFLEQFGNESAFARELYMSWKEIRQLQRAGMLIAGHTHRHRPLSTLSDEVLSQDLETSRRFLDRNLKPQCLWPFSYPYGKRNSYSSQAMEKLRQCRFDCAFATEIGPNRPGVDLFELNRMDCKGAIQALETSSVSALGS